jgi:hypothetical protein
VSSTSFAVDLQDIHFVLFDQLGMDRKLAQHGKFADLDRDVYEATLAETKRIAEEVLGPINRIGDRVGDIHAAGGEDRVPQRGHGLILRQVRKHLPRPARRRGRHQVPVDREAGDQFQRGPIGDAARLVRARHLRRVLAGQQRRILSHHRQPRGSTLTIKPIGEKIAALGLIQQESLPLRNGAKLYFHNSPSSAILAME